MIESPQHHGDLLRLVAQLRVMRAADPRKAAECDLLIAKLAPHVQSPTLPQGGGGWSGWEPDPRRDADGCVGVARLVPVVAGAA